MSSYRPRIVTSPLVVTATVGSVFAYNTGAVGTPASYTIPQPSGRTCFCSNQWNLRRCKPYGWTGLWYANHCRTYPVSIIVNYSDDDGNLTDTDSNPDQLGSLFPPQNAGDPDQVILTLTVNAIAPTVTSAIATSVGPTALHLLEMLQTQVGMLLSFVFIMDWQMGALLLRRGTM